VVEKKFDKTGLDKTLEICENTRILYRNNKMIEESVIMAVERLNSKMQRLERLLPGLLLKKEVILNSSPERWYVQGLDHNCWDQLIVVRYEGELYNRLTKTINLSEIKSVIG
jgi:hypothetical protein